MSVPLDIAWEANYGENNKIIVCELHGDRNTVVACPVCVGYARSILLRYEKVAAAIKAFAEESDFCVACGEHPSHGHAGSCVFEGEW